MSVRAMKAGAVEFLTKPFREQELLDAIREAISRDRVARQQRAELEELRRRYESLTPREREVMAGVVDGLQLLQRLVDDGHRFPIVILTAHGDGEACRRALHAGAVAFLTKPFDSRDLLATVDSVRRIP